MNSGTGCSLVGSATGTVVQFKKSHKTPGFSVIFEYI